MPLSAVPPPTAVNESCIEFTAPVDVIVVPAAHVAASATLRRCSFPSMLGACVRPAAVSAGVVRDSAARAIASPLPKMMAIAANRATPWRGRPSIRPNRKGIENAINSSDQSSSVFVNGVPLSNG